MDAFYASIEQRDNADYRGKPIVVGGSPEGRGGVVAAASYEARKFGVRSAMPSKKALQLCKHLIFVRPRFDVYKSVSEKIREIFSRYTDLIEPLSLDEAYLDVTADKQNIGSAIDIATAIRSAIKEELQLTASAGISINKFVAKIASDINKPDGLTFIGPSRVESFMENLPIEKFHGVGKVTADKMRMMGIFNGADLKKFSEPDLMKHFGKSGMFFYKIVRGLDDREVRPNRETKSVGAEDTFASDLTTYAELEEELKKLAALVHQRLEKHQLKGRTITVKIKFHNFKVITRSQSTTAFVSDFDTILKIAMELMTAALDDEDKIRLLGISVSNFVEPLAPLRESSLDSQLKLF
jgi:DNA polymerase-4